MSWKWMAAKATGTSHTLLGKGCDDAFAIFTTGEFLVGIVCDGAGSAQYGAIGARRATRALTSMLHKWLSANQTLPTADQLTRFAYSIHNELGELAMCRQASIRDYATTLIVTICDTERCLVLHIGDGAAVTRERETGKWSCVSWPLQCEYAGQTAFLTDTPLDQIKVTDVDMDIDALVLFSDGMERLLLDFAGQTANQTTFESLIRPLDASETNGFHPQLAASLNGLLESPNVNRRTDDDKTLVIAARIIERG